jgi:hypothetical protein
MEKKEEEQLPSNQKKGSAATVKATPPSEPLVFERPGTALPGENG